MNNLPLWSDKRLVVIRNLERDVEFYLLPFDILDLIFVNDCAEINEIELIRPWLEVMDVFLVT